MGKKTVHLEKPLTEVELEIMNAIWELSDCSVKEVQQSLAEQNRDLAYTSVATMMKILEQKGALVSRKSERAHTYTPAFSREAYQAVTLKKIAHDVFSNDASNMAMRLISDSKLTDQELIAIRKLIDEKIKS